MPILKFPEYKPDLSDLDGEASRDITNVFARADGYGPVASLAGYTATLAGPCLGFFFGKKNDGTVAVFAGTSTKLYLLNNTTLTWTDVSRGAGTYTAVASTANWQFAQFNNFVFATQVNDKLQIIDLTSPTAFADRADNNCPNAAYITVVNQFLVLSGLAAPNVYRIQWSGLADVSSGAAFTPGINSADFQDLADGGIVRGVGGGEYGTIFQDTAIRTMIYAPGSPVVFTISRISQDDGMFAPYSLVRAGNQLFWVSAQGFKKIAPGGQPIPIGKERVDRTFFANVDTGNLQLVIGANDPTATRVYFAYKSVNGATGQFDTVLAYDWVLDRWTVVQQMGEYLASLSKPGVTLEGVDAAYGTGTPVAATSYSTTGLITATNTFKAGDGLIFTSSGTLPGWYVAATPYYVMSTNLSASQFQVSATGGVGTLQGVLQSATSGNSTSTSTGSGTLSFAHESIETLNIGSLDNISNAALSQLAGVTSGNAVGFFTGSNLQATVESQEFAGDDRRFFVRGFRAVCDSTSIFGSVSHRESPQASYTYTSENTIDARGYVAVRQSTRFARAKLRVPSGSSWSFVQGVYPDVKPEGLR